MWSIDGVVVCWHQSRQTLMLLVQWDSMRMGRSCWDSSLVDICQSPSTLSSLFQTFSQDCAVRRTSGSTRSLYTTVPWSLLVIAYNANWDYFIVRS